MLSTEEEQKWTVEDGPHVDVSGVVRAAQQDVRRPVPERYHLVGVCLRRDGLCSS